MRQIHYRWFAVFAFGLAVMAGLTMPVFWGWDVAVDFNQPSLFLILILVAGVLLVVADVQMGWQAWRFQKERGFSSLWVAILGQSAWFILTLWMYLNPMHVTALKTVTLPITMFGIGLLMLTLSWTQRVENLAPVSNAMMQSARRLSWLSVIFAVYGLLFFGLTWDWQIGLAVATASMLVIDPRWPLIFASQARREAIDELTDSHVKIYNPAALDQIKDIKQAVVEKTGVLTSRQLTVYNVDSIDDNFSAQDVLAIMAGLEQEVGGLYAEALVTYSHNQGVYPVQAENVEVLPLVGLQGTIQDETYMLVSATNALQNNYVYHRQWLKDTIDLGNSVSVLVKGSHAIGAVAFGAPLIRSLIDVDDFFVDQKIITHIASSDTQGSLMRVQEAMRSLTDSQASLSPDRKQNKQREWAETQPTALITNQRIPVDMPADVVISFIDEEAKTDFVISKLVDVKVIWQAARRLNKIDHSTLTIWQFVLITLIVLAAGLEILLNVSNSVILMVPIVAVLVRSVVTFGLRLRIKLK
ncbi:hypothetical protein D3P96_07315 [Weissella viridescens]|uniref:ATPase P n=1 Tax=Weissella viridescens TaxID=1629 RepID=A0A3P2RCS9_WEIVI|nr:hypothetical protein [Weissella viridescens]RRG17576.1 hypothetical protein D3P96_07315 [Weissella viridescens]